MRTLYVSVLLASCLCSCQVPSIHAASLATRLAYSQFAVSDAETDTYSQPLPLKRDHGVDAWSICPPHMTNVDCFYAYLRVYARLRKAAENSDRVSMRNIGKRSSASFQFARDNDSSLLRLLALCPEGWTQERCYQVARNVRQQILANLQNAHRLEDDQSV